MINAYLSEGENVPCDFLRIFCCGGLPSSEATSFDCPDGVSVSVGQGPTVSSLGLYNSLIRFGT